MQELGELLREAGQPTAEILRVMNCTAKRQGIIPTWNYKDVAYRFGSNVNERAMDATNILEILEQRVSYQLPTLLMLCSCHSMATLHFYSSLHLVDFYYLHVAAC